MTCKHKLLGYEAENDNTNSFCFSSQVFKKLPIKMNNKRSRRNNPKDDDEKDLNNWGDYFSEKKSKLLDQYRQDVTNVTKESDIFQGIAIFVNGITNPNAEELKRLMSIHGGVYHTYRNSQTTHVIASNLPNVKITKLGPLPIVKPSWIVDSIDMGKLQDHRRYLLYTSQSVTQPALKFTNTKTASDPNFLEEFYNNSRLHLISTLGAEFKQFITKLRANNAKNNSVELSGLKKIIEINRKLDSVLFNNNNKVIMHIDMDCFFVSVGLRKRPELRGLPVAVTHARNSTVQSSADRSREISMNVERLPQRLQLVDDTSSLSEVASCSYEARKCGVRNGMFLGAAVKLCPGLKTIPYDFQDYRQVAHILYETVSSYTLNIEAVSCDEMYVDITEILNVTGMTVEEWGRHIRAEVTAKTDCPCSAGFGANRLQARLATKKAKPSGQFHLKAEQVQSYIGSIKIADLPGVGHSLLSKFVKLGFETCRDIQNLSLSRLKSEVSPRIADTIWNQVHGVDNTELNYNQERKSVSAEVNYGIRFTSLDDCFKFLEQLSVEVAVRLTDAEMKARCVTLKLMVRAKNAPMETAKFLGHGICDCLSRSKSTTVAMTTSCQILTHVKVLYDNLRVDFRELRGVGIQLTKLEKDLPIVKTSLVKFLESTKNPVVGEKSQEIHSIFKETKKDSSTCKKLSINDIDLAVLDELPEDIRQEVMQEYQLNVVNHENNLSEERDTPPITEEEEASPFDSLDWRELRASLTSWIGSNEAPSRVDRDMLIKFFRNLVLGRKLEDLRRVCNFFGRNLECSDCVWHDVYRQVMNATQEVMVAFYGGTLRLDVMTFQCCT